MAKHITNDQRNEIYALKRAGHKQKDIARLLHKHPSAISRELKRNKNGSSKYLAKGAKLKTKIPNACYSKHLVFSMKRLSF